MIAEKDTYKSVRSRTRARSCYRNAETRRHLVQVYLNDAEKETVDLMAKLTDRSAPAVFRILLKSAVMADRFDIESGPITAAKVDAET